jgi:hypothetical protein
MTRLKAERRKRFGDPLLQIELRGAATSVRALTVDITSGSSRPSAAAQATAASSECQPGACTDANNAFGDRRIFELDIPFVDTRLRVAIADDAGTPSAATNTKQQHLNDLTRVALPER